MRMSKARAQTRPISLHVVVYHVRHLHVIVLFMSHSILSMFVSSACMRWSRLSTRELTFWRQWCISFVIVGGSCMAVSRPFARPLRVVSSSSVALFILID